MSALTVELRKGAGGDFVLKCLRPDGSVTWQKNESSRARFFPLHDLTHYAVETALGAKAGFYGLIAAGWDIVDTTGKGSKGALPDEALAVEHLVGLLDAERTSGTRITAAEVNAYALAHAAQGGRRPPRPLTDELLNRIRSSVSALHAEWIDLRAGDALSLKFAP